MSRIEAMRTWVGLGAAALLLAIAALVLWWSGVFAPPARGQFSGTAAYQHVLDQVAFGPRITGADGSLAAAEYISATLAAEGWEVEYQDFEGDLTLPLFRVVGS